MFEAQYLFKGNPAYSPWSSLQGDNVRFTADLIAVTASTTFKVEVFHKNTEETGDGTNVDAAVFISLTAAGRSTVEWTRLKEMLRYKFTVTGSNATDNALFRMLSPIWFDTVLA